MTPEEQTRFYEAVIREWTWKSPAMKAMTLAVCRLAIEHGAGREFSANDLPECAHGGPGIAGSVFFRLAKDGIIAPVQLAPDCPKITTNKGGNKISVYRLASAPLAKALLRVHGAKVEEMRQEELAV